MADKTRDTGNLVDGITGVPLTLKNENTNTAIGRIGYDQTAKAITIGNGTTVDLITLGVWATWIPTLTGFSVTPTILAARYCLVGKACTVHFRMTNAASNATTFTLTFPFAAANTATQILMVLGVDNGAQLTSPSRMDTRVNSNIVDVYKTFALSSTWTSGGPTKGINFVITYEIA